MALKLLVEMLEWALMLIMEMQAKALNLNVIMYGTVTDEDVKGLQSERALEPLVGMQVEGICLCVITCDVVINA